MNNSSSTTFYVKFSFSLLVLFSFFGTVHSQNESLSLEPSFLTATKYFEGDIKISKSKMASILKTNKKASALFKKGNSTLGFGTFTSVLGGAALGYPLGQWIASGDFNENFAFIGVGLTLVSVIIYQQGIKKMDAATKLYNADLTDTGLIHTSKTEMQIQLGTCKNGIGIMLAF